MLTALYQNEHGLDVIYEVEHVERRRAWPGGSVDISEAGVHLTFPPGGKFETLFIPERRSGEMHDTRFVAVMNTNGKTVAKYDL